MGTFIGALDGLVLAQASATEAPEVDTLAAFGLGLVLLLAGIGLLRWLLPLIERALCRDLERTDEPPVWGGNELIMMVVVIFIGITAWYTLLQEMGSPSPIDALLATDLALFMAVGVGAYLATLRARLLTPPPSPGALGRALGLGSSGGLFKPLLFAAMTLALATPAILGVMNLWPILLQGIGREPLPQDVLLDVLSQSGLGLGIAVVLASFVGPALEELLFRGFLQPVLRGRVGIGGSIVLTSFLFASIHGLDASGPVFCLSLVLCYLRERTDRLAPSILAHCLWNGTTLMLSLAFVS